MNHEREAEAFRQLGQNITTWPPHRDKTFRGVIVYYTSANTIWWQRKGLTWKDKFTTDLLVMSYLRVATAREMQSSSLSLLGEPPHFPAMLGRIFCKRVKLSPAFVPSKEPSKSSFSSEAYASANACLQHALQTFTPCCLQQKKPHNM